MAKIPGTDDKLVEPEEAWEFLLMAAGKYEMLPDRLTTRMDAWELDQEFENPQSKVSDFFKSEDLADVTVID